MENPYLALPDTAFWRRAMIAPPGGVVDPVVETPFRIGRADRVATAGSCFAQHLAAELNASGFALMIEEGAPDDSADAPAWRAFSAAYGNVYTARQLLQLFERAYGLFRPVDRAWRRSDGCYVDPFRPAICAQGFANPEAVEAARVAHLAAVRRVFDRCDVFIFTLGLTECWVAEADGAVFPVAPGVVAAPESGDYRFHNLTLAEVVADMERFLGLLREVNPGIRILLTVSPVPLIATYAGRHVLVSTVASKAILRTAADMLAGSEPGLAYFPSYEIITGPQARGRFWEEDLRSIAPEGVRQVMDVFGRHFLQGDASEVPEPAPTDYQAPSAEAIAAALDRNRQLGAVICDEELLDKVIAS